MTKLYATVAAVFVATAITSGAISLGAAVAGCAESPEDCAERHTLGDCPALLDASDRLTCDGHIILITSGDTGPRCPGVLTSSAIYLGAAHCQELDDDVRLYCF